MNDFPSSGFSSDTTSSVPVETGESTVVYLLNYGRGRVEYQIASLSCDRCGKIHRCAQLLTTDSEQRQTAVGCFGSDAQFFILEESVPEAETGRVFVTALASHTDCRTGKAALETLHFIADVRAAGEKTDADLSDLPSVSPETEAQPLRAAETAVVGIETGFTETEMWRQFGEADAVRWDNADQTHYKWYDYPGVSLGYVTQVFDNNRWAAPDDADVLYCAIFSDPGTVYPRGIRMGDSFLSVVRKFPQEQDYRLTGELYGTYFAKPQTGCGGVSRERDGLLQIDLYSEGYWPRLTVSFDTDQCVSEVSLTYRSGYFG